MQAAHSEEQCVGRKAAENAEEKGGLVGAAGALGGFGAEKIQGGHQREGAREQLVEGPSRAARPE